jgi:Homeodomain
MQVLPPTFHTNMSQSQQTLPVSQYENSQLEKIYAFAPSPSVEQTRHITAKLGLSEQQVLQSNSRSTTGSTKNGY